MIQKKHSLGINAVLNVIQQLCAVIFPLITIPYVSRVLETENYGKVNFTNSIISYFILLAQLGVATYGVREVANTRENKDNCNRVVSEIFSITVFSALISYILLFGSVLLVPKLYNYKLLFAVQGISIAFYTIGAEWINKGYEDYAFLTIRYIIAQVVSIVMMFLFVKTSSDYVIYALITTLAQAGAYTLNFFHIRRYSKIRLTTKLNLQTHLRPLLILFFNGLATTIYVNSDSTILGLLQDDASVGIYNIAAKIYITVKHVINAIVLVSIPRLSRMKERQDHEGYNELVNRIFGIVIVIVFPAMFGLMMLSYSIIYVFSGVNYLEGVLSLKILSGALIFAVIGCYLTNCILIPIKRDKIILYASSISAIINILLNLLIIPRMSYTGAAITTLIAEIVMVCICFVSMKKHIKIEIAKNNVIATLLSCIVVVVVCLIGNTIIESHLARIAFSLSITSISYLLILKFTGNDLIAYTESLFRNR